VSVFFKKKLFIIQSIAFSGLQFWVNILHYIWAFMVSHKVKVDTANHCHSPDYYSKYKWSFFGALSQLNGWQEGHLACKNLVPRSSLDDLWTTYSAYPGGISGKWPVNSLWILLEWIFLVIVTRVVYSYSWYSLGTYYWQGPWQWVNPNGPTHSGEGVIPILDRTQVGIALGDFVTLC